MDKIKLMAIDFDGTTLNSEKRITDATLQAISKAIKNGILIGTNNLPTDTFTTDSSGNHSHSNIGGSGSGGEESGGSNSSNTTGESGEHIHTFRLNTGNQERIKTIPNYYTLIFIMKL